MSDLEPIAQMKRDIGYFRSAVAKELTTQDRRIHDLVIKVDRSLTALTQAVNHLNARILNLEALQGIKEEDAGKAAELLVSRKNEAQITQKKG